MGYHAILRVKVHGQPFDLSIIQEYAPTSASTEEEIEVSSNLCPPSLHTCFCYIVETVEIHGQPCDLSIIQVYAPTSASTDEEIEASSSCHHS